MSIINHLKNKAMPFALATAVATASLLSGCAILPINRTETRTELSDILNDEAVVVSKKYVPEEVDTGGTVIRTFVFGPLSLLGPPQGSPAEYNITLTGEKTNFKLDDWDLYNAFQKGDVVIVNYRKVYDCTYDDINGDGKKELISREFEGNRFLGARLKKN